MIDTRTQGERDKALQDQVNSGLRGQVLERLVEHGWCESASILSLTSKRFEAPNGHTESVIAYMDTDNEGNLVLKAVDHFSKENNFRNCSTPLTADRGARALNLSIDLFDQKVREVCAALLAAMPVAAAA